MARPAGDRQIAVREQARDGVNGRRLLVARGRAHRGMSPDGDEGTRKSGQRHEGRSRNGRFGHWENMNM